MTIDFLQGGELEHLPRFITSLAVGLLIGLERERSPARLFHHRRPAAGKALRPGNDRSRCGHRPGAAAFGKMIFKSANSRTPQN